MRAVAASLLMAACVALPAPACLAAADPETAPDPQAARKSRDLMDLRVPIPSYSKEVVDNGCHLRKDAHEVFVGPDADIRHVAFSDLISETVGRYSVRAILDKPPKFAALLAPLDADTRTLALLDVLRMGLGRDGLHTFFLMGAGQHAPAILEALQAAGLKREHEVFSQAMALFGPAFPVDNDARSRLFSYSSLDTPLNAFDVRMIKVARAFGSRETFEKAMVAYVERTPALWQSIEAKRAQLGEVARLRYLNQALLRRIAGGGTDDAAVAARLAGLPIEQRTLVAADIFNGEFENGGVHQFFFNSSGAIAPEVHAALIELGLDRQAAIFERALDMFGARYPRDTEVRRDRFFAQSETPWDKRLQALTDDFYALDGGPAVVRLGSGSAIEGGPGLWSAMAAYARSKNMLPC